MVDAPMAPGTLLLLHGLMGGWDELIILAAGVLLAVVVVKWTSRSSHDEDEDELLNTADGVNEKQPEQS
jgi:hypothetical protein